VKVSNPYFCDACGKLIEDPDAMVTVSVKQPGMPDDVYDYHGPCARESFAGISNQAKLVRKYYVEPKRL
jgi:hypothetical protein